MDPKLRSNFRHLYADVFWFGVLAGSAMAFLAVYASRINATAFQIGVLTAGPAAVSLLFSLPAGQWLVGRHLIRVSYLSAIWHRIAYFVLILLPWLFSQSDQVNAIILLTLLVSVPGTVLAIAFNAMFADVTPPDYRAEVVGKRNALVAVSITVTSIVCGQLLDRVIFPLNYQIVFGLGAFGAMMSTYHISRIRPISDAPPRRITQPLNDFARPGSSRIVGAYRRSLGLRFLTRYDARSLIRLDLVRSSFGPFLVAFLLFYTFQFLPVPLFPLVFVRELGLSDGAISLGNALYYGAMLIGSLRLNWVAARFGHRNVLIFGAIFYCIYPLLLGLAKDATLYWTASLIGGIIWSMTNGGLVNRLMERVPEDDRPAHMALHNLALNLGILLGSMSGPVLGESLGLRNAVLVSAGLRLLGGILFGIWA